MPLFSITTVLQCRSLLKAQADFHIDLHKLIPGNYLHQVDSIVLFYSTDKGTISIDGAVMALLVEMAANTITTVQERSLWAFAHPTAALTTGSAGKRTQHRLHDDSSYLQTSE